MNREVELRKFISARGAALSTAAYLLVIVTACTESSETPAENSADKSPTPSVSSSVSITTTPYSGPVPFPLDATIPELQRAMKNGRITSVELVDFYLARIEAYDDTGPALSAVISVNPDARDEAAALDAERATSGPRGPLHGIPVVVKDNIDTSQMPTTAGTLQLERFRPAKDASQVRKLREAGAIIIAKANLATLAQSWQTYSAVGGQTLNPYDTSREPGGSSGGTAVAVAANFAAVGLGTDTCGSNRLPAGLNNLYGLRPTSGLSSRAGVIPFSSSLDAVGPMTRTIRDLAIVLDATAGKDPADPSTVPNTTSFVDALDADGLEGRRIGVLKVAGEDEPFNYGEDVDGTLQEALDEMAGSGAELVEVDLPRNVDGFLIEFMGEFPSALAQYLAAEPTAPARAWAQIIAQEAPGASAEKPDTKAYTHALATRKSFRHALEALMEKHDLDAIAYPVSPTTARPIGGPSEPATIHSECAAAAVAGVPALAIPVGFASDGLPVGLELMGRAFDESTLFSIAAGYEAHTDHRMLPPTTPPLDVAP